MKGYKMGLLSVLFGLFQSQPVFADTKNLIVIDVRTSEEYQESHVKDSENIDVLSSDFSAKIAKLDKNKTYKVYCRSGNRSGQAERLMKSLGFKDVENIGSVNKASRRLDRPCVGKGC